MLNRYTIKIDPKNKKVFSVRDKDNYLVGFLFVEKDEVRFSGAGKLEIAKSARGEEKTF